MKTYHFAIIAMVLLVNASTTFAQINLYPDSISGFEIDFWINNNIQPANTFTTSVSDENGVDGTRSVKFDCPDVSLPTGGNANAILGGTNVDFSSGNIAVTAGDYIFEAKIFVVGQAPSKVVVYLADKAVTITGGLILTIPLSGVETGSWQSISKQVTISTDILEMKTGIRVNGVDYSGMTGSSTIYIDQIGLFHSDEVPDTSAVIYSPLLDPDNSWEMNSSFSDEFNSQTIDQEKWDTDVKDWGTWSWEPENVSSTDTVLALKMQQKQHTRNGNEYYFTSGIAQVKETVTYGYFESRIKASAKGQGTCPAFWLYSVGQPIPTEEGGVQYCEIDAIEIFQIANQLKRLEMNLHTRIIENGELTWKRPGQGNTELTHSSWDAPWDPRDEFHTYGVWNRLDSIFWYVDGIQRGAKKNYYWHLPMHVTLSMGLRTPYEKYIDGVRTVMPYPESNPEEGFPSEMFCDYIRTWNTPAQLFAEESDYQDVEFDVNTELDFKCRYFAGNESAVLADDWNGVACKLQEIKSDGTVVSEITLNDNTAVGKVSGSSIFKFSLEGLTPSDELTAGNSYVLKPVFKTSQNSGEAISLESETISIKIVGKITSSNLQRSIDESISIYPNPTSNLLYVKVNTTDLLSENVVLYNMLGEKVFEKVIKTGTNQIIDVSGFQNGFYIIRVGNLKSEKIIIN